MEDVRVIEVLRVLVTLLLDRWHEERERERERKRLRKKEGRKNFFEGAVTKKKKDEEEEEKGALFF